MNEFTQFKKTADLRSDWSLVLGISLELGPWFLVLIASK